MTKALSWSVMKGISVQAQPSPRLRKRGLKAVYMKIRVLFHNKNVTIAVTRDTYDDVYTTALQLLCEAENKQSIPKAWIIRQPSWDDILTKLNIVESTTYRYDQK